ncbi:unnamed protein product [Alopecurus aequalis]
MSAGIPPARRVVYLPIKIAGQHSANGNNHAGYITARSFSVLDYEWQIDYHPEDVRLPHLDGNCFVQCRVALFHESDTAAAHPSGDLGKDLGNLLSSQNDADVTFVAGAESFRAHRCVLAARSPVFAADLAGSLLDETHEVKDMDADTFRALLHFIYTDALPLQLEYINHRRPESGKEDQVAMMVRRLLDAADRYRVERLKMICEEKVCARVGVATVAADLVLAERRGYNKLKTTCMEFLVADPPKLLAVATAGDCKLLETSCPSVLTEIVTAVAAQSCLGGDTHTRSACAWHPLLKKVIDFFQCRAIRNPFAK